MNYKEERKALLPGPGGSSLVDWKTTPDPFSGCMVFQAAAKVFLAIRS